MRTVAELTLGREPDAVPRARRLVRSALGEEMPAVAGDAELVVSELVTNAALHGEAPITVRLLVNRVARVEVHDRGRSAPILLKQGTDAMTGRGLSMVAAVASDWGVDPADEGKTVWAELDPHRAPAGSTPAPVVDLDALMAAWADDDPATATYTVQLGPVSTELLLAAKAHIDNVVRELTLMREGEASSGVALPAELSALIQTVTVDFAEARTEIKRQAAASAARGDVLTDLELHLSPSAADAGERYLIALDRADRYARSAHLLTLAPPRIHRLFRQWYVRTIIEQLRAMTAGEEPPTSVPFQVVLAEDVARLDDLASGAERLNMMQRISSELAGASSIEQMARIAVERAVEFLGVESARVRMVEADHLRSVAWKSRSDKPDHDLRDVPLDSELPAAMAVRSGQPVHIRSLAETFNELPSLRGHYAEGQSGHAVPLVADGTALGVITLTFAGGELSDDAELAFVSSLADVLAHALRRADEHHDARQAAGAEEVLERLPTATLAVDESGLIALCNAAAGAVLDRDPLDLLGQPLVSLMPARLRPAHQAAFDRFIVSGEGDLLDSPPFTVPALRADGSEVDLEMTLTAVARASGHGIVAFATLRPASPRDGTATAVSGRFLDASVAALTGQRDTLERMMSGDPLPAVLESLVGVIESVGPAGCLGSVLLVSRDGGHLVDGASPSLPRTYVEAVNGLEIGPNAGSCGTAAYTGSEVVVEDISADPLWDDYRHLAVPAGLRACWSTPILAGDGDVLGTFAVYHREPYRPSERDRDLLAVLVRTAAVAIGRARADQLRDAALRQEKAAREELQKAHDNLTFVLEATTRVASSLDSDDTLRTLARIAVPALADICLIDLLDGVAFRRAATAASEAVDPAAAARFGDFAPDASSDHPAAVALRTGRAVFLEGVDSDLVQRAAPSEEHRALITGIPARSAMAIPLAARGRSLGAMTLIMVAPGRRFTEADKSMVEDLGRRVALAIDNTQLYDGTREAERRLRLVARAGVLLTSSLDLDTVVARLGQLVKGEVADSCEIHVRRTPDQWWHLTPDSGSERLVRSDGLPALVAEAVETRSTVITRSVASDVFTPSAGVEGEAATTVVPLVAHGEVVGVIALVSPGASEPTRLPAETLDVIAGRAALAIDNALLYEQERTAAEILQRSLLPPHLPSVVGVSAAARYLPAGARNEIGGDWYDLFRLSPDRIGIVMGDVMGRGIPAASVMGQLRNGLRMLALQDTEPAEALQLLNRMLGAEQDSPLATVAYGVIDIPARSLDLANAGHLPPLLIRRSESSYLDQKPGLPLGAFPDTVYTTARFQLEAGDALILYTDGLIEERNQSLEEGLSALLAAGRAVATADPDAICDAILAAFRRESDEDDTAVLALVLE